MGYIVDLSHHQVPNKFNYDAFAKQLDFAIIRTQYGSSLIDRHYKTHHAELQKRGVPTGAYAWVRGTSIKDMEVEATDFYNRTKEINPVFWFLDVEEKSMNDMRGGIKAYVKKLRALGAKKIGVYIGHHLYKQFNIDTNDFDAVWIPRYGDSKPAYPCDLWQYTDKGRVDGYNGNLDLNKIISGKPLTFFTGDTQTVSKPKPTPEPSKPKPPQNDAYLHVVKSGDTLSEIAAKYGKTVSYLTELNELDNPNRIYVGQRIKLQGKVNAAKYHTVAKGDVVSRIAQKYGTTTAAIKSLNPGIKNINLIYMGQKIRVK